MRTPDFLIIGAQKAGTTSLYEYLRGHPEIWFPDGVKETHFFTYWGTEGYESESPRVEVVTSVDDYLALFQDAPPTCVVGEASPSYLYDPEAPGRVREFIPDVSLIALLRDPVERAFSNYLHAVRSGRESLSFEEALDRETGRMEEERSYMLHYREKGFYGEQLERYFEHFDEDQILVLLSEELWEHRASTLRHIFRFLGVDPDKGEEPAERHGASGVPRNAVLRFLYRRMSSFRRLLTTALPKSLRAFLRENLLHRPHIDPKIARRLREVYREDIKKLQDLTDRNLSHWLNQEK